MKSAQAPRFKLLQLKHLLMLVMWTDNTEISEQDMGAKEVSYCERKE
jgi:hypothetical protein